MFLVYGAYKNADMTEGRGPMVLDKTFSLKEDCDNYIDKQSGVMGRKGKWSEAKYGDWETKAINVCESVDEADKVHIEEIREKALKKLSVLEKKALGLS